MESIKLTGRTRYRVEERFLRNPLVVLQVECHTKGYIEDEHGLGPSFDYCFWRDAEFSDITVKDQ